MLSFQTKQPVIPSSKQTCQDTQEQLTQEPDHLDSRDILVQQELLHQVKDMLEGRVPHLRVKDIQGLLLKAILELEHLPGPKGTQELGLHLDNKDTEEHLLLTRDMVVEHLLKAMADSNSNNRHMVEQLLHLNRVVDMLEDLQ